MPYRLKREKKSDSDEPQKRKHSDIENIYKKLDPTGAKLKKKKPIDDFHLNHDTVCSVVAKTGSGKTNLVANLVDYFGGFHRVIVFCSTPLEKEPIYQYMEDKFTKDYFEYHDLPAFESKIKEIETDEDYREEKILVILDDFLCSNNKFMEKISHFATKSRKATKEGVCFVIVSQSYFDVPKLLRNQIAYNFFMSGFDRKDFKLVCSRFSSADLEIDDIYKLYLDATKNQDITDFFLIDRRTPHDNLKFRNQIYGAYIINENAKKDFFKAKRK
jgi:hypothetical protein